MVSSEGQFPKPGTEEQTELLSIGPMCRFAQDLAPMLQVLADRNADMLRLQTKVDVSKLKVRKILFHLQELWFFILRNLIFIVIEINEMINYFSFRFTTWKMTADNY